MNSSVGRNGTRFMCSWSRQIMKCMKHKPGLADIVQSNGAALMTEPLTRLYAGSNSRKRLFTMSSSRESSFTQSSLHDTHTVPVTNNLLNQLIQLLSTNNDQQAYQLFLQIQRSSPSLLSCLPSTDYNTLINSVFYSKSRIGHSNPSRLSQSVQIYNIMLSHNIQPIFSTLCLAINIYGRLNQIDKVESTYLDIRTKGYNTCHPSVLRYMCQAYILSGNSPIAMMYFELLGRTHPNMAFKTLAHAYALKGDELGIISFLDHMDMAEYPLTSAILVSICKGYHQLRKYEAVFALINHFTLKCGKPMDFNLYRIMIQCRNDLKEYQTALDLIQEMRESTHIRLDTSILHEELVAFAGLRNTLKVWSIYRTIIPDSHLFVHARVCLARMVGPLHSQSTIFNLKKQLTANQVGLNRAFYDLLRGYTELGDVTSVKQIIYYFVDHNYDFSPSVYAQIVWAYIALGKRGGCIDGAWEYVKHMPLGNTWEDERMVWHGMVVCRLMFSPEKVDEVINVLKLKFPHVDTNDVIDLAHVRIDRGRSRFNDRWDAE
ncbi:Pentatricopeptide repeat-containing protein 1, mitochondrial [Batrachochytrium dendrobatidis]